MSQIIKDAFKSVETKALEHFELGTKEELTERGRHEFLDYIYETGDTNRDNFIAKVVGAYKEINK